MEYYAKSRQKILTQGEIDKVKNELEDLIMNLEGEFTETDLKIIRNNISHLQDTEEEGQGDSREPVQEQKNQLTGELHATQTAEEISIPEENRDALFNLQTDPKQEHPIKDLIQEQRMINLMCRLMQENDAPAEQYVRIGLQQP